MGYDVRVYYGFDESTTVAKGVSLTKADLVIKEVTKRICLCRTKFIKLNHDRIRVDSILCVGIPGDGIYDS